jgi:DNA-binding PadR family transcriptional regulator
MEAVSAGNRDWMRGSSPLKGALLGLVLQRPGHGYDLANRLDRRLGPAWQITAKDLYRMLEQLERAGLVSSRRVLSDGPTGNRRVYSPTLHAEPALTEWMTASTRMAPVRAEFQAKIAVARVQDAPRLLAALDAYERECFALFNASSQDAPLIRSFAGIAMHLSRASARLHLRAELEWIVLARRLISEVATPS